MAITRTQTALARVFPFFDQFKAGYDRLVNSVSSDDMHPQLVQAAEISITAAQIATLRATPVTLVAAPGAGYAIEFVSAMLILDYTAPGFTETADNLVIGYVNASGKAASEIIETTGFIDQVADTITQAVPDGGAATLVGTKAQIENAALVLYNNGDGEFGGSGGSTLRVKVTYRVHATGL
jgi:hypothetical protein